MGYKPILLHCVGVGAAGVKRVEAEMVEVKREVARTEAGEKEVDNLFLDMLQYLNTLPQHSKVQ